MKVAKYILTASVLAILIGAIVGGALARGGGGGGGHGGGGHGGGGGGHSGGRDARRQQHARQQRYAFEWRHARGGMSGSMNHGGGGPSSQAFASRPGLLEWGRSRGAATADINRSIVGMISAGVTLVTTGRGTVILPIMIQAAVTLVIETLVTVMAAIAIMVTAGKALAGSFLIGVLSTDTTRTTTAWWRS